MQLPLQKKISMSAYNLAQIKDALGNPYFSNDRVLLYNMDCVVGLKKLQELECINSVITSPPYNIGKEYEKNKTIDDYIAWLKEVFTLTYQASSPHSSLLLNLGYVKKENAGRAIPIPYLLWNHIKYFLNQEIVWNYGAGVACKHYLSPRNEKVLWYVKEEANYTFNLDPIRDPDVKYPNQKKNGKIKVNALGKNPSDVWQIPKVTSGANRASKERMPHPAQFPEELIRRLVLAFTNEDDLILDPFLGSGTTAIVASNQNRYCLGFEIDKSYCDLAINRIKKVEFAKATTLFG